MSEHFHAPENFNPDKDTEHDLLASLSTADPIVLHHGTTKAKYDAFHKGADGHPHPKLRCGAKGDFGWGGENSALYTTTSGAMADHYAQQAAEYDHQAKYVILTGTLDRSKAKILEIKAMNEWQAVALWGWKRAGTEPAIIHDKNVVAGWVSTFATIKGSKNYWPVKYWVEATGKYAFDFQYAILSQAILDAMTWTVKEYDFKEEEKKSEK